MKFKYISAAAMGLAVLMSSCDATDLKPWNNMTDASYWHTVTDLQLYANGLLGNFGGATAYGDDVSDLMVQNSADAYLFGNVSINTVGSDWDWGLIRRCNFFLNRYEQVEGDEAAINQYVAEVRFVRANRYFTLIRLYGDVPWFDVDLQTTDTEELYKGRDPRNFVLGKIIEDLEFASQWCVESKTSGRPTKDAALQQLARVCLYYGTYMKYHNEQESNGISSQYLLEKARDASKKIMDSGKYSIVKAANPSETKNFAEWPLPYSNLFVQDDLSGCAEAVMARYYEYPTLTHEVGRQAGSSGFGLSKAFADCYLMANGKPIANAGSGYHGDNTLEEEIQDRDPRMWQTIATSRRPNWTSAGSAADQQMTPWDWAGTIGQTSGVTGYAVEKFHSSNMAQWQAQSSDFDWFIYRYAEVLLINAEANYELGTCTQAVLDATINKLRDRVDMAHLTTSPEVDAAAWDYGYSVAPLLYEIRRERAVELINEGFRMDDLKRWNAMKLLENPMTMVGVRITDDSKAFYEDPNNGGATIGTGGRETITLNGKTYLRCFSNTDMYSDGRKWTANDKRWLYPIPETQMDLYKLHGTPLTQNPGW